MPGKGGLDSPLMIVIVSTLTSVFSLETRSLWGSAQPEKSRQFYQLTPARFAEGYCVGNRYLASHLGGVQMVRTSSTSVEQRMQIFRALVEAQDRKLNVRQSRKEVADEF